MTTRFTEIDIEAQITIPRLPGSVPQILAMIDAGASARELAPVVERDPALTVSLFQTCNSALYGCRKISSIGQALLLLGQRQLRTLVVVAAAERLYADLIPVEQNVWQHQRDVATTAGALADRFAPRARGDVAIGALLHDLGQIVIGRNDAVYWSILEAVDRTQRIAVESARYTFSHADLGALLASRWQLPDAIQAIIFYHHDLAQARVREPELVPAIACVALADHLVHERTDDEHRDPVEREALVAPALEALGLGRELLPELGGMIATAEP
jgi:putative nucleotidyltransferase with HDIG domain